jgi:hypothetical protein
MSASVRTQYRPEEPTFDELHRGAAELQRRARALYGPAVMNAARERGVGPAAPAASTLTNAASAAASALSGFGGWLTTKFAGDAPPASDTATAAAVPKKRGITWRNVEGKRNLANIREIEVNVLGKHSMPKPTPATTKRPVVPKVSLLRSLRAAKSAQNKAAGLQENLEREAAENAARAANAAAWQASWNGWAPPAAGKNSRRRRGGRRNTRRRR